MPAFKDVPGVEYSRLLWRRLPADPAAPRTAWMDYARGGDVVELLKMAETLTLAKLAEGVLIETSVVAESALPARSLRQQHRAGDRNFRTLDGEVVP